MSMTQNKFVKSFAVLLVLVVTGCGYSDYPGHPGHKTQKEAYVPSMNTVISGWGDEYDGTYVHSVKYNNRNWQKINFNFSVKITSYKNIVTSSYPHRPNIFPDADDFNRATGFSGGDFHKYWIAEDKDPNAVGGLDNFDQSQPLDADGNWIAPGLILTVDAPEQEVDRVDWDLQSSIKNAAGLLNTLVSNKGKVSNLELTINGLELDGQLHSVENFNVGFSTNGMGVSEVLLKKQKSAKNVLNTIIENTEHLEKVDVKLHFTNGMAIALPKSMTIMFNHDVLQKLAK